MRVSEDIMAVLIVLVLLAVGCFCLASIAPPIDEAGATRVLQENGYTDVNITGYTWWGCGEDDWYHTGFEATSPNGSRISGTVCAGFLKDYTIRFN